MSAVENRVLPRLDPTCILMKEKHAQQGIDVGLINKLWEVMCKALVKAEYGNLWCRLHGNAEFAELIKEKNVKALKYLFPKMIEAARAGQYSYLIVESTAASPVPALALKAGLAPRYMNSETGSQCNALELRGLEDKWPKFRALKSSISAVLLVRDLAGAIFVIIGKNKPNGSGRPVGVITGYKEPSETFEEALRREVREETKLRIPENMKIAMIAKTLKVDYYPDADDANDVGAVCFDLSEDKMLELTTAEDSSIKLIQHQANGEATEIQADDDLAELFVLPYQDALGRMKPESSGHNKVLAALEYLKNGISFRTKDVSFGWRSQLQSYDDVKFTTPAQQ